MNVTLYPKTLLAVAMLLFGSATVASAQFDLTQTLDVADVVADFPVGFSLVTSESTQYVGYYNAQRMMTVASRNLSSNNWSYKVLPSEVGYDSHNYIEMSVDRDGHLHVAGNMHNNPMNYFRTMTAGDISTLQSYQMTGQQEGLVSYPRFLTDNNGGLVFNFRNGRSGNGARYWNKYNQVSKSWSRLIDVPLLDGEGLRNAYPIGPDRGADGWFHMVWVWRDSGDAASNNNLSYARSRDLVNWESAFGESLSLPITLNGDPQVIVDPIPSGGGIINGSAKLVLDMNNRPVISYHKNDSDGNMQIYAARAEGDNWLEYRLTNWDKPITFGGGGSLGFIGIQISELSRTELGYLSMTYRHKDFGRGTIVIDDNTLVPVNRDVSAVDPYPAALKAVQSSFPKMSIRRAEDSGFFKMGERFILQWETLGKNKDEKPTGTLPPPQKLKLHKITGKLPFFPIALNNGDVNNASTWGGVLPESRDGYIWRSFSKTLRIGTPPNREARFNGRTLYLQPGGKFLPNTVGVTAKVNNIALDGGRIQNDKNSPFTLNLTGDRLSVKRGIVLTGNSSDSDILITNGRVVGSGLLDIRSSSSSQAELRFGNDVTLSTFLGVFQVTRNGILNLPDVPAGKFGLDISGSGRYINDSAITVSSLKINGNDFAPGVYSFSDFSASERLRLIGGSGSITVVGE